jgi:hypothetical protein
VHSYGPNTTHPNTTVFTRATQPTPKPYGPSSTCMATPLIAAQDSISSARVPGPAKEELHIVKYIWDTTIDALEEVLATGDLDHESFGWRIWGLCAGHTCTRLLKRRTRYLRSISIVFMRRCLCCQLWMRLGGAARRESKVKAGSRSWLRRIGKMQICASLMLQRFR